MPRNAVRIIAGVTTNETPALNETGISSCNLIRLKYDPQGLVLPEKLGGWARFAANQVTSVIRCLLAWEDINANKWLAYGSTGTGSALVALLCSKNAAGLTTAGQSYTITPYYLAVSSPISFSTVAGTSAVTIVDPNTTGVTVFDTVNITTPISVGGIIIFGEYPVIGVSGAHTYTIGAQNVLQLPQNATYTTLAPANITGITQSLGNMTVTFTASPAYFFIVGEYVIINGVNPLVLNGTYLVTGASSNSVTVVAPSGATAYVSGGTVSNQGMAPKISAVSGSSLMTVFFPDHGYSVGSSFTVLNGTTIGGMYLFGEYSVRSVSSPYVFTFYAAANATSTEINFLNGQSVINGSLSGTTVTLTIDISPYAPTPTNLTFQVGSEITVTGITPANWNGSFLVTASTSTTVSYVNAAATGTWAIGGSVSDNGGDVAFVYNASTGQATSGSAYGTGVYGAGVYNASGTIPVPFGNTITATNWQLDNWGEKLIAMPIGFTPLAYASGGMLQQAMYYWNPLSGQGTAQIIPNSPPTSNGFFVGMPQRQIIAWGSSFDGIADPLLIRWCDVGNYTVWVAQVTNQAGSFRLSSGSKIIGALQGPQQAFVWTDLSLWSMQYSGPPYVYNINRVGDNCGLIGRHAAAIQNGVTYWMGTERFYAISGEGVSPIPCPVWDVIFQQLDMGNLDRITAASNSLFGEVTWYYPIVGGSGEVTNYVRYNTILGQWDFGVLGRSAWVDNSVLGPPIGYDPANQYIYQHEISPDADGMPLMATFQTGYFAMEDGNHKTFIDEWWSDMNFGYYNQSQTATVSLTFYTADFPEQTPTVYGPYTLTQNTTFFSPRFRARLISLQFSSNDVGSFWRVGLNRYRYQSDGKY